MTYLWTASVMGAAAVIVYRCLAIANSMDADSNHAIRAAVCLMAVIALGEILAPLTGRVPDAAEGWVMIAMGLYFSADRRRPAFKREQQGVRA